MKQIIASTPKLRFNLSSTSSGLRETGISISYSPSLVKSFQTWWHPSSIHIQSSKPAGSPGVVLGPCDPGRRVFICCIHPLAWGSSVRIPGWYLVSDCVVHPRTGSSLIRTDGSLVASGWPEPGTAQSSVACVNPWQASAQA